MQQSVSSDYSMHLDHLPVLGICGSSGAGKTTLIEAILPVFIKQGLNVAVVKYRAHNIVVDNRGKDSDRFYRAGSDVWLWGDEFFSRRHDKPDPHVFLGDLCRRYDLVLVEGHAATPVQKIWLHKSENDLSFQALDKVLEIFPRHQDQVERVVCWIEKWLKGQWQKTPVWGCVLIGGKSNRMGTPKHLINSQDTTWLEATVNKLKENVDEVVISGQGQVPESLKNYVRLPDIPAGKGPLAGILSVMRWAPVVSWLVIACDLPLLQEEAMLWLKEQRAPGVWAVQPALENNGQVEPLLAYYDFRCSSLLENIFLQSHYRLSELSQFSQVKNPCPPVVLQKSWKNVNTPLELKNI